MIKSESRKKRDVELDLFDGVWLPESDFELTEDSDFEVIDKEKQQIDYSISIK